MRIVFCHFLLQDEPNLRRRGTIFKARQDRADGTAVFVSGISTSSELKRIVLMQRIPQKTEQARTLLTQTASSHALWL